MKMFLYTDLITWFLDFLGINATNISDCLKEWFGWDVSPAFIKIITAITLVIGLLIILYLYFYIHKQKTKKWRRNLIEQKLGTEFRLYSDQEQNFFKRVLSRLKESSNKNIYIETRFQSNPPHDKQDPEENVHSEPSESLMKFYLEQVLVKNNTSPFLYCVLGGSGMGKTTFAINLLKQYINKYTEDTIPFDIYIYNLGNNSKDVFDKIKSIKTEKRPQSILILDALDENIFAVINYEFFKEHLENLIKDFRIVIITCRTQFFDDENKEPNKSSLSYYNGGRSFEHYHKHYISVFNEKDIKKYLIQKYSLNIKKRKKAISIVRKCNSLMVRPLLFSYIDDLLQENEEKITTITKIYEILIEKWINREVEFWETKKRNQIDSERLKKELYRFSEQLAKEIYERKDKYGGLFIPKGDLDSIVKGFSYNDYDFKGRSLVNRDAIGNIKFSHKSFLEYFLAKLIFQGDNNISYEGMDMAKKFYLDFCDEEMRKNYRDSVIIHTNDDERMLEIYKPFQIESWMKEYFQHIQWFFVKSEIVPSLYTLIREFKNKNLIIFNFSFDTYVNPKYLFLYRFREIYTGFRDRNIYIKTGEMIMALTTIDFSNNNDKFKLIIRLCDKENLMDSVYTQISVESFLKVIIKREIREMIEICCGKAHVSMEETPQGAMLNFDKLVDLIIHLFITDLPTETINNLRKDIYNCSTLNDIAHTINCLLNANDDNSMTISTDA